MIGPAFGACLGENGTIIGVSANVVIVDIARKAVYPISFWQFFKCEFPVMIGSILMSALYLWFLFLYRLPHLNGSRFQEG